MRHLAFLIVAAAAVAPAQGAKDPYGRGRWTKLVKDKAVQKKLALTDGQLKSITGLKSAKDKQARLAEILKADQLKMLKRLRWKDLGGYALFDDEVADALAVTDAQKVKLEAAHKVNQADYKKMRNFMARARFRSRAAMLKFIAGYRDKADKRLLAILTKDQQAKLKKLVG